MISLVIPVYNEESNLSLLAEKTTAALEAIGRPFEIILINDGSKDKTRQKIGEAAAKDHRIKGIHFRRNFGQTAAMAAGFKHAKGDIIVAMDGDLQNDPADIPLLLKKLDEGHDVVSGWRKDRKDHPIKRNFLSRVANRLISRVSGVHLHDYGCSLKAYRREALDGVHLYGEMHRFIPIYAYWNGAKIGEIAVSHHPRTAGVSKYGMERTVKVVLDLIVVMFLHRFSQKPMHIFGLCGLTSFLLSGIAGLLSLYYKFWGGKTFIQTPLPLIVAALFIAGVLCILMGLLAELSIRTYHESQDKPTYLIAATDNTDSPV